jgi:AAA domain/Bifunctional DNA primase/polymerase, N-terminal/Primase C terminal 2 (PriCT-2)
MVDSATLACTIAPAEAVVRLARQVPVFPCRMHAEQIQTSDGLRLRKAKSPLTQNGLTDATQDPEQIRAWWRRWPEALVGARTGSVSDLVVIDYDSHKADFTANDWVSGHTDQLIGTRTHSTVNGGRHYLFRPPPGVQYRTGKDITLGSIQRKGLDLRAEGGYIIWWPLHGGGTTNDIALPLPADLIEERRFDIAALQELPPLPATSPQKWTADRVRLFEALPYLNPDDYDEWTKVGFALHLASAGSDSGFELWHAWSAGGLTGEVPNKYSGVGDCRYHWTSYLHDKPREKMVTLGSIFHLAKARGYKTRFSEQEEVPMGLLEIDALIAQQNDEPQSRATVPSEKVIQPEGPAAKEPSEKPARFPMQWTELEAKDPPLRVWRINHWLTSGPTLLAGAGGVGKTLIAQTIATALALGRRFLDDVSGGPMVTLFWACEDDHDELWRRQVAICRYFDIKLSDLEGKLIIEPRLGRENTLLAVAYSAPVWTALSSELIEQIQDYKAEAAFIDNIGQTFGGNENDRHHVTMFINGLTGLVLNRPFTSVLMGHPAKNVGSEFSGSTAWENAVRMRWYMGHELPDEKKEEGAPPEDPNVRYLCKRKTNYTIKDYRKLTYLDGVFQPEAQEGEFSRRYNYTSRNEGAEECVLEALKRLAEVAIRSSDGRTSPDYLPKKMRDMKLAGDFTPRELADALGRLRLSGRIIEGAVGKFDNRTVKMGLKVMP